MHSRVFGDEGRGYFSTVCNVLCFAGLSSESRKYASKSANTMLSFSLCDVMTQQNDVVCHSIGA